MTTYGDLTVARLDHDGRVHLTVGDPFFREDRDITAVTTLDDLADRLDCIIIRRDDLPEVTVDTDRRLVVGGTFVLADLADSAALRRYALETLAVAEHLDVHPPVDPAQVNALADLITSDDEWEVQSGEAIARRLLATGKVTVTTGEA